MRTWKKLGSWARHGLGGLAFSGLFAPGALAHPDYWVTIKYQIGFSETAITEIELEWEFDVFFSSQAFNRYDLDRDGTFSGDEARALQSAIFDPLADNGYFVRVYRGASPIPTRLASFAPRIDGDRLVITFTLLPTAPVTYREAPLAFATHDEGAYDFTLSDSDFLKVAGAFDPTCRFRIEDGTGPLDGIPQTVVLLCPK